MEVNLNFLTDILNIDSTSSKEGRLADYLEKKIKSDGCNVQRWPEDTPKGEPVDLLVTWGDPKVVFCTHIDTVPPYIPPTVETDEEGITTISGRGACDAKGQLVAMYTACRTLAEQGKTDFGLLLVFGEETGSFGAKAFKRHSGGKYVIVGEPTDNKMVSASKGTKAFAVTVKGKSFHSGYPQYGVSAVERFVDLVNKIREYDFPIDPQLGETTYNIGQLVSDNPQNILSERLTCRIYFRTTFASDRLVKQLMEALNSDEVSITPLGGDTPSTYLTLPGFKTTIAAFGSDAPHLSNFEYKMVCGPGSILVAHTSHEYITLRDLESAVENYVAIYDGLQELEKA